MRLILRARRGGSIRETSAAVHSLITRDDEATPLRAIDPLAHRALEALVRAEATLTRRLAADLDRIGVSATGFTMLVLLTSAGGQLELRMIRRASAPPRRPPPRSSTRSSPAASAPAARLESDRRAVGRLADAGGTQPRHPRLPRPRRARPRGLRRPRRGREAPARRALPQARPRGLGAPSPLIGRRPFAAAAYPGRALVRRLMAKPWRQ